MQSRNQSGTHTKADHRLHELNTRRWTIPQPTNLVSGTATSAAAKFWSDIMCRCPVCVSDPLWKRTSSTRVGLCLTEPEQPGLLQGSLLFRHSNRCLIISPVRHVPDAALLMEESRAPEPEGVAAPRLAKLGKSSFGIARRTAHPCK